MLRHITALTLAATVAATAATGPAQAQSFSERDRTAAVIFGLAALAAIAAHANQQDDDDDDDDDRKRHRTERGHDDRHYGHHDRGRDEVIRREGRARLVTVPSSCRRSVLTEDGRLTGFPVRCLRRAGVNLDSLPRRCTRRVEVGGRVVTGYAQRCLRRAGVRVR